MLFKFTYFTYLKAYASSIDNNSVNGKAGLASNPQPGRWGQCELPSGVCMKQSQWRSQEFVTGVRKAAL